MNLSPSAFVEAVRRLDLLDAELLRELEKDLAPTCPDLPALARAVKDRGWLTPYQMNRLAQGKADELVLGPYLMQELLGEGGMGQVFRALQRRLRRPTALKVIHPQRLRSAGALERFQREAEAVALLDHPNIVRVYDAGEVNGRHFLAMEYLDGTDLARLLRERGPLPVAEACSLIGHAALGLQHAHERGLVHRDLKPSNLMLTRDGVVKILDLGLARVAVADDSLTPSGMVLGTPDYLAPEQALNAKAADIRADIYSLGCTLYHLLAGGVPFPDDSMAGKLLKHQTEEPVPLEERAPAVPPGLAMVVRKLMARQPEDRYQTPAEAIVALAPWTITTAELKTRVQPAVPAGRGSDEPHVAETVSYQQPGEPTLIEPPPGPRGRRYALVLVGVAVVAGLLMLPLACGGFFFLQYVNRPANANGDGPPVADGPKAADGPKDGAGAKAEEQRATLTNSIDMELVLIPAGKFMRGSPPGEPGRKKHEGPPHEVRITRPFYLGKYPVTQGEFERVTGSNPSHYGPNGPAKAMFKNVDTTRFPVEKVSWIDAVQFCEKLTEREAAKGRVYALPTEAEFEYAARAGTTTAFSFGDAQVNLLDYGWHRGNGGALMKPVGLKKPNPWSLHDMHGLVWQWCADYSAPYEVGPQVDPFGKQTQFGEGRFHALRAGCYSSDASECRSASRFPGMNADRATADRGFRVKMRLEK